MTSTPTTRADFWRDPALPYAESRRACHSRNGRVTGVIAGLHLSKMPSSLRNSHRVSQLTKRFDPRTALAPGFADLDIGIGAERLPLHQQIRRVNQGGNLGDVRLCHTH